MSPAGSLLRSRTASALAAARVLAGGPVRTAGALVLAYHDIGEDRGTFYQVGPGLFRDQLSWAKAWGVTFVPLSELVTAWEEGRHLDGMASVAFDDALVGVHQHGIDVLRDLRVPATIFAVSDRFGASPSWWPESARVMTASELREAVDAGLEVASHSRSHPSLPTLHGEALSDEVAGSRAQLEDLIQRPVDLFAYPFGHYDPEVRHAVGEASYRAAFSFLNGRLVGGEDAYRLPRLNMWGGQRRTRLAYHLARPPSSWGDTQPDAVFADATPSST